MYVKQHSPTLEKDEDVTYWALIYVNVCIYDVLSDKKKEVEGQGGKKRAEMWEGLRWTD